MRRTIHRLVAVSLVLIASGPIPAELPAKGRTDRYGDPLPPGALLRLGTVRLRQQGRSFAFSPDGKRIASLDFNGNIRIWDTSTGKERCRLGEGVGNPERLAYSPDGKLLAVAEPQDIRLWDTASGKCIRKLPRPRRDQPNDLVGLVFSPEGKHIAAGEITGGVTLWDVATGSQLGRIDKHQEKLKAMAFLADGKRLLTVNGNGIACVWETDGRPCRKFRIDSLSEVFVSVSTDGKTLIIGTDRPVPLPDGEELRAAGLLTVWDIATGKERRRLETQAAVVGVALSPDGKTLAYIQDTASVIQLRDMGSWKEGRRLAIAEGSARDLAFSPDCKILAARVENSLELWDVASGQPLASRPGHAAAIDRVIFTANGRQLVSISRNQQLGTARVWDALSGQYLYKLPEEWNWTDGGILYSSRDGKTLLLGDSNAITVWDVAARRSARCLPIEKKPAPNSSQQILALALSSDGRRITSISEDGNGRMMFLVCDAANGRERSRRVLGLSERRIGPPTLSLDGRFVATMDGGTVWLRDVASGAVRQTFHMEKPAANEVLGGSLLFSHDSRLLACISGQGGQAKVRLWEVLTGTELPPLLAPWAEAIAFASKGRTLATGGDSGSPVSVECLLRLWDIPTGKEVGHFKERRTGIGSSGASLAFSPDGQELATGLMDSTVLLWDVKPSLQRVKASLPVVRPDDFARFWGDLAGADAGKAQASLWSLAENPDIALPFLEKQLTPARATDAERLRHLIADLDSEQFAVRKRAAEKLRELDLLAEPALRKTLEGKPSLECRRRIEELLALCQGAVVRDDIRQMVRAVAVLEHMDNAGARRLLTKLGEGAAEARLTREARSALERLGSR